MKSTLVITTMLMAIMGATLGYTSGLGYTSSDHIAYTVQSSTVIPQDTITPKKQTPRKKDKSKERDLNERTLKDQKRDTTSIPMPPDPPVPQPDTMPGMRMK